MCERYSWIEKGGAVLFLTGDNVYNTSRGKELQKHTMSDDYYGHGAIRFYFYNLKDGTNKECTDFSSPKNFPPELAEAIKAGRMAKFGVSEEMRALLTKKALAEYEKVRGAARVKYEKVRDTARVKYEKVRNTAWAEYEKVRDTARVKYETAWAEYEKVRDTAWAEYEKARDAAPLWAEYEKVRDAALAEYEKVRDAAFWRIFSRKTNRAKAWR